MTTATDGGETTGTEATSDFEAAQRRLFEAVGIDPRTRDVHLRDHGVRVRVYETGPAGDDPPLVFVHGTAAFGAFMAPLVAQFDDVRAVVFDRPGYGLSDPFEYAERTIRDAAVDVLAGVLDELELGRVDVVGHSMGGYAGLLFARAHPDRVRRLVTVGAIPTLPGTRPPLPVRLLTTPGLTRVVQRLQKPGVAGVLDVAETFGEREAIQRYPALMEALAAHEATPRAAAAGRSEFASLIWFGGWRASVRLRGAELRGVRHAPTVIWGTHDPLGRPDDVRATVESIPGARFETVDAGHIPYLAHPERCAALVRAARDAPPTGRA